MLVINDSKAFVQTCVFIDQSLLAPDHAGLLLFPITTCFSSIDFGLSSSASDMTDK